MSRVQSKTFTDQELEILRVLWAMGESSVKDIQERLPTGSHHHNSVQTIVRVLERKGHITHREQGRLHMYRAVVPAEESRRRLLDYWIDRLFAGSAESLVLNLVETGSLSVRDLDRIRDAVRDAKRQREAAP